VSPSGLSWTILIPIKRLDGAKTRLRGALTGVSHRRLVVAMTLDTVTAALACPVAGRVVVVTDDPAAEDAVRALGAEVVPDLPDAGLNQALAYAATVVRPKAATAALPGVAALAADLPALRSAELADALRAAAAVAWPPSGSLPSATALSTGAPTRAFVPDAGGTGTVLLAAPPGARLEPCFGPGSAGAHLNSGAILLAGEWPGLRRDVDTAADLAAAVVLGLGVHTAAVVAETSRDPASV
jgi:2-phospho-L-lactate guanylyltransferase